MTEKNTQQDDRNLVESSATVDPILEDKLQKIWDAHHMKILGVVFLLFIVVTGYHAGKIIQKGSLADVQNAYLESLGDEAKELEFAKNNEDSTLAGVVFYQKGVDAFDQKEFTKAIEYFGKASSSFDGTIMKARSLVALAVAQIDNGDEANGKKTLLSVASDEKAFKTFRGEAYLKLLVIAIKNQDTAAIDNYFEKMNAIEGVDQILARAHSIRNQFENVVGG